MKEKQGADAADKRCDGKIGTGFYRSNGLKGTDKKYQSKSKGEKPGEKCKEYEYYTRNVHMQQDDEQEWKEAAG